MSQLWAKDLPLDALVHRFTVGDDPVTDLRLVEFDAMGSAAHARMLHSVGLLSDEDVASLVQGLQHIASQSWAGKFKISADQEDCHTAIEQALVAACGDAGKRIHLGRSRNDQVQLATRLWMRAHLFELVDGVGALAQALLDLGKRHKDVALPGYTHMRRAMPSSVGQWTSAFAEGLLEDIESAEGVFKRIDRCPLGAAAGFGVPLPLDRELTAELLGFERVQRSTIDVQNSRGRHELALAGWLVSVGLTVEKLCWDLALYSMEEFGFVKLPDEFTTGSSIMPQKRNPDVIELARAKCRELRGRHALLAELAGGLPSSYHRDFQLLKRPLFDMVDDAATLLVVMERVVRGLQFDGAMTAAACSDDLFAANEACRRVGEGATFRDAYREVASELLSGTFKPDRSALAAPHTGGLDNLGLEASEEDLVGLRKHWAVREQSTRARLQAVFEL